MNDFSSHAVDNVLKQIQKRETHTKSTGWIDNTMRIFRHIMTAVACYSLLSPLAVQAQRVDDAPWYDVEIIIFSNTTPGAGSTEHWQTNPDSPNFDEAINFSRGGTRDVDGALTGTPSGRYSLLPKSTWQLNGEYRQLQRSSGTSPLIHTAWRQQVRSKKRTPLLRLYSKSEIAPGAPTIEGTIQVSVQRYLHVNLDLNLREVRSASGQGGFSPFKDYRFISHRKMRSGELHFIDHPKAGMLILVSKYKLPEIETLAPETEETAAPATEPAASQ